VAGALSQAGGELSFRALGPGATVSLFLISAVLACTGHRPSSSAKSLETAPSRYANLDGVRIHYKSLGKGREALLFVHGWAGNLNLWRSQVPLFAERTRVVLLDLPGHGQSDKPRIAYTMDLFARAIDAVLRDAGVNRAVLVGHSMGTPVVRQFYRLFPEKTLGLVAADGALKTFFEDRATIEKFIAPYRGPQYKEAAAFFIDAMFINPGTERLRDWVREGVLETPQHVMVAAFEGLFDLAIWRDDPIRVPLLVLNAKNPFWTAEYEASVRKLSPGVEYKILDGTGHFLMLEKPAEFNAIIEEFLEKNFKILQPS